ncbi:MAG: hypothetical protein IJ581_05025 [Paludibacteraceae bacterium]|nr:hypothetical protein [Paludibacteraceae bacterium]
MKKVFLIACMALASLTVALAQPRAVGVNIGPWSSLSYQHGFGESNMLDVAANVILPIQSGIGAGGHVTYDWIDPFNAPVPWNNVGEWHWYMGVGASGGFIFPLNSYQGGWYGGVAAHVGIEYDFWFPFQLSLDWRPSLGLCDFDGKGLGYNYNGLWGGVQIGVRYKFNN